MGVSVSGRRYCSQMPLMCSSVLLAPDLSRYAAVLKMSSYTA